MFFLRVSSIFFVLLIVLMTPAFAIEMEEVAHHAEKYNEESKKNHGFFAKIKLIAKGFNLVDEAKQAEKEGEKKKSDTQGEVKEKDEDLFKKHNQKILDKKELLNYRNREKSVNNTDTTNQTLNSTNTTNTIPTIPTIPQACITHVDSVVNFLLGQGLQASYTQNNGIDSALIDNTVQIIDPNGNIRYGQVISLTNTTVILNTGTGNREYSLDEFTKSFTGITLQTNTDTNTTLNNINNNEQNNLNQEKEQAHTIHNKAHNQVILWGTLIGVAAILLIIGIIMTTLFGYNLIQVQRPIESFTLHLFKVGGVDTFSPEIIDGLMTAVNEAQGRNLLAICTALRNSGIQMGLLTVPRITFFGITQNWVNFILCTVGLILVLVGIGLLIAGIIKTVQNGRKWHMANIVTRQNKKDTNDLKEWTSTNNTENSSKKPIQDPP